MVKNRVKNKSARTERMFPGLTVSDRVELKDVCLITSKCNQTSKAHSGKKTYNIDYSAKVQTDKKNGYIIVIPGFHFEAFGKNENKEPVIVIDASFVLTYKIDNFHGLTQKGFEQFANLNGIYNAWPYWREFVQNTIGRMGLPALSIPVFRIVEPPEGENLKEKVPKKKATKKASAKI